MNFRVSEEIVCTVIDSKTNCLCGECIKRSSCNGITFLFLKNKLWVETISDVELFERLRTLNPQFEFQGDTLRHTVHDCVRFGEMMVDIQPSDVCNVCFQYNLGESVINWRISAVVPVSSVLHYHVVLPLSLAMESLCRKQDLLNNKLSALDRYTNRLRETLMLPMNLDTKKEDANQDFDLTYDFSGGLLPSSVSRNLFCEASKHLFTPEMENVSLSEIQMVPGCESKEDLSTSDLEAETKRRNELHKKLAGQLVKSKGKEVKRHGILRK
ncbi:unnamed protein product [Heterobilharzia americana]|nr:unnamed protein product [Heterobilharzia americana]